MLDYTEAGIDAVTTACPSTTIVLAGDFNSLDDTEVATRGALLSIVDRPTRGNNTLDRVYVNNPCYTTVRVVDSAVKSDHKAVVAYAGQVNVLPLNKRRDTDVCSGDGRQPNMRDFSSSRPRSTSTSTMTTCS